MFVLKRADLEKLPSLRFEHQVVTHPLCYNIAWVCCHTFFALAKQQRCAAWLLWLRSGGLTDEGSGLGVLDVDGVASYDASLHVDLGSTGA